MTTTIVQERLSILETELLKLSQVKLTKYSDNKKLQKDKKELERQIANYKAYLALSVGQRVTDGRSFGIITQLTLSNGGMPEAWVNWHSQRAPLPEQPSRLTAEPIETTQLPVNLNIKLGQELTIDSESATVVGFELCPKRGRILPKIKGQGDTDERLISWDTLPPQLDIPNSEELSPLKSHNESQSSPVSVEVIEEEDLTPEEESSRAHLERLVERAFYQAGKALEEIRARRLFRSSHKTFEEYCRARFGFERRRPYQLIDAAQVVDNLIQMHSLIAEDKMCTNGTQNELDFVLTDGSEQTEDKMCPIGTQILPTSERQVRSLVPLTPDQQREAWTKAVQKANGKAPSGRLVNDVVKKMTTLEESDLQLAHHLKLKVGGLVEIHAHDKAKIHHRLARIACVGESTVEVWVRDVDKMEMNKYRLKHNQVELVPLDKHPSEKALLERIARLRQSGLDMFELEMVNLLDRCVVLTPVELAYLEIVEQKYS